MERFNDLFRENIISSSMNEARRSMDEASASLGRFFENLEMTETEKYFRGLDESVMDLGMAGIRV